MTPQLVRQIQEALRRRGFLGADSKPLVVDGLLGHNTNFAIVQFKRSVGLRARPYVGPITLAKLLDDPAPLLPRMADPRHRPPWYLEALSMLGKHEVRNNAELALWLRSDGATVGDPAKVPYCGDGVETSFLRCYPDMEVPKNPYLAANWAGWGQHVPPQLGCVLSFWRGAPTSWKGHVGFYAGESESNFYVLGFNQSNSVTIAPIRKDRLRDKGSRWPVHKGVPPALGIRVQMSGGVVSTNEA